MKILPRNKFFVALVYFSQGSAGIVSIASSMILREKLGLDFFQIGIVAAASAIPWSIKPLYGLLTDLFPIANLRRKPYLHIGAFLGAIGYFFIGISEEAEFFLSGIFKKEILENFLPLNFSTFLIAIILANIGLGLLDVATDGLVVENTTPENAAQLQGITQTSIRTAAFFTSFFSGLLIHRGIFSPFEMYFLAAIFPATVFIFSFFVREKKITEKIEHEARELFSKKSVAAIIFIFLTIIFNLLRPEFLPKIFSLPPIFFGAIFWSLFFIWIIFYFLKLQKLKLTSSAIFVAALFIFLWRFNPSAGSPLFFYLKNDLQISTEKIGFFDTAAQIGSILGIFFAVKFFEKFDLKKILGGTVFAAAIFGFSSFAIARPEIAEKIGNFFIVDFFAKIISAPVYFFENIFSAIFSDNFFQNFSANFSNFLKIKMSGIENFLFVQNFLSEFLYMIAYIPLLKFAVLICPKKAEATNFAVIASIMNIGIALSSYVSGFLYEFFKNKNLPESAIDISAIEKLIWINIFTSLFCLFVLPFLRIKKNCKI